MVALCACRAVHAPAQERWGTWVDGERAHSLGQCKVHRRLRAQYRPEVRVADVHVQRNAPCRCTPPSGIAIKNMAAQ
jgi:hypothetical protein